MSLITYEQAIEITVKSIQECWIFLRESGILWLVNASHMLTEGQQTTLIANY